MAVSVGKSAEKPLEPVRRLCNEIQLFDLCDLEKCRCKQGLFCTDQELLSRFESIADVEERPLEGRMADESDEDDENDDFGEDGYGDSCDDENADDDSDEDR